VSSLIAETGSFAFAFIISVAPKVFAISRRSDEISSAITFAPIAVASCVADNPTGPCPKIAIVSPP
jgi:hypothetical protein